MSDSDRVLYQGDHELCPWILGIDGFYETGCESSFIFEAGMIKDNGFVFCPYCGKEIKEKSHE